MDIPTNEQVIAAIESFLERHDMRHTRFGREATGNPNLVKSLRDGAAPTLTVLQRVSDYMKRKDLDLDHVDGGIASPAAASSGKSCDLAGRAVAR